MTDLLFRTLRLLDMTKEDGIEGGYWDEKDQAVYDQLDALRTTLLTGSDTPLSWTDLQSQLTRANLKASVLLETIRRFVAIADPACLVEKDHPHAAFKEPLLAAHEAIAAAEGTDQ